MKTVENMCLIAVVAASLVQPVTAAEDASWPGSLSFGLRGGEDEFEVTGDILAPILSTDAQFLR